MHEIKLVHDAFASQALSECVKRPLDGQYFCIIFEVAQCYWMFVGMIGRLYNVIDGIKTFLKYIAQPENIAQYIISCSRDSFVVLSFVSLFVLSIVQ